VTWVPDSEMSLLIDQSPGGFIQISDFKKGRVNPQALAGLAQQCVRMVYDMAHKRAWAIRLHSVMLWPATLRPFEGAREGPYIMGLGI
jgi:hypothetical protein